MRMDERKQYLEAYRVFTDEQMEWLDAQLDLAFEGRNDYVRYGVGPNCEISTEKVLK